MPLAPYVFQPASTSVAKRDTKTAKGQSSSQPAQDVNPKASSSQKRTFAEMEEITPSQELTRDLDDVSLGTGSEFTGTTVEYIRPSEPEISRDDILPEFKHYIPKLFPNDAETASSSATKSPTSRITPTATASSSAPKGTASRITPAAKQPTDTSAQPFEMKLNWTGSWTNDIPLEIRDLIYRHTFTDVVEWKAYAMKTGARKPSMVHYWDRLRPPGHGLFFASKQVSKEVIPWFWRCSTIDFRNLWGGRVKNEYAEHEFVPGPDKAFEVLARNMREMTIRRTEWPQFVAYLDTISQEEFHLRKVNLVCHPWERPFESTLREDWPGEETPCTVGRESMHKLHCAPNVPLEFAFRFIHIVAFRRYLSFELHYAFFEIEYQPSTSRLLIKDWDKEIQFREALAEGGTSINIFHVNRATILKSLHSTFRGLEKVEFDKGFGKGKKAFSEPMDLVDTDEEMEGWMSNPWASRSSKTFQDPVTGFFIHRAS